jgi:hypothetical protein
MHLRRPAFAARQERQAPASTPPRASFESLLRRCEESLCDLPLSTPFDIEELTRAIAARRNRPIVLQPVRRMPRLAGLCVPNGPIDVIVYYSETSPMHREHIILHELCHLWLGHEPATVLEDEIVNVLGSDLDAASVHLVFRRVNYTTDEEREVEVLASLILKQAVFAARNSLRPTETDELRRLGGIMASDGEAGA